MRANVDKKQLLTRLEWARRVSPHSTSLTLGTDLDILTIQIGEHADFHSASFLADIEEDGAVSVLMTDIKDVNDLKGSTVQIEVETTNITFSTDEASITVSCEPTALRQLPKVEELGKVDLKALKAAMTPVKESVGKKSEKGSDGLLEASVRLSGASMTILATNRLTAWSAVIPVEDVSPETNLVGEFVALPWAGVVGVLSEPAQIVKAGNMYGVKDEDTLSLFPINTANDSDKLNEVFARMRADYASHEPVVFEKKRLTDALTSLKNSKAYAKIEFSAPQKARLSSFDITGNEENTRTVSFSIDYEGTPPIESVIISPVNLLKTLKGAQGRTVAVHLPSSPSLPVGITESPDSKVSTDSLGLAMTVTLPQG